MYEHREYPDFSWSHSRDRMFRECARKYYWQYYGSHNGWLADERATDDARHAYRLKNLTTLHLVLGQEVHECCRDTVLAAKNGRALPSLSDLAQRIRGRLRHVCAQSRDKAQFMRWPKRVPMLQSYFFHDEWDDSEVEAVRLKMERILANFYDTGIWDEIRAMRPDEIVLVDKLDSIIFNGVSVYAAPDLVLMPGDRCIILDWKTGESEELAEDQLALYAVYVQRKLGLAFEEGKWVGRIANLLNGGDAEHIFTKLDLHNAYRRIEQSISGMRQFVLDAETNRGCAKGEFPLIRDEHRYRCATCPYYPLCAEELGGTQSRFEQARPVMN